MKKFALNFLLILIGFAVYGQNEGFIHDGGITMKTFGDFYKLNAQNIKDTKAFLQDNEIEGSPYLRNEFQNGYVLTSTNIKYQDVPLRYNIYNDEIEFQMDDNVLALDNPDNYQEVAIGGDIFINCPIKGGSNNASSYFIRLNNQKKLVLLKRFGIEFLPAKSPQGYVDAKPATFKKMPVSYYVKFEGKPAEEIGNLKSLLSLFGDKSTEMETYIKKEKLKLRNEEDLLKIISKYNLL
ncbi:MAG: hypothetical protein JW729_00790 [Bacteroidales bacterium]|nr:hypothetical protein [Bacteroidales bacterium]